MPLPSNYLIASPPLEYTFLTNVSGEPLSGGKVYFYSDPQFSVPKPVYQQTNNIQNGELQYTPLRNPLILSSIGTFVDDSGNNLTVFYWPYEGTPDSSGNPPDPENLVEQLYFIQVSDSNDALQFSLEYWPPNVVSQGEIATNLVTLNNILTNQQFSEVNFPSVVATAYSVTGTMTLDVAPGWYIDSTGTGTITVQQIPLSVSFETEAPYALQIQLTVGLTATLNQKINQSPRMFADKVLYGYFQAACTSGQEVQLTLNYIPSNGAIAATQICQDTTTNDGQFKAIKGPSQTAIPYNPDAAPGGNVIISLELAGNTTIQVTSFQVVGIENETIIPQYIETSIPQQQSELFWYWQPKLNYKPIPSYLVGWDFPLNPAQFGGGTSTPVAVGALTGNNASAYIWDQTILFQNVSNAISYFRSATTNGLSISTTGDTSFALVQYLDAAQAREILSQRNAIAIKGAVSTGTLTGTVSLYWTTAAFPTITATNNYSLVQTIDGTTSVPTVPTTAGNWGAWTKVPNKILKDYGQITLTTTNAEYDFIEFDATASAAPTTATGFAIVVSFGSLTSAQIATFDYISLVGGDIATRPAPQTPDEVLRECQYYWEKSYNPSVLAGTASSTGGALFYTQAAYGYVSSGNQSRFCYSSFVVPYNTCKRSSIPVNTIYSPNTGTVAMVHAFATDGVQTPTNGDIGVGAWTQIQGNKAIGFQVTGASTFGSGTGASNQATAYVSLQFTADARIGIV